MFCTFACMACTGKKNEIKKTEIMEQEIKQQDAIVKNGKSALVLIDIQKDYFPGGTMELVHATSSAEKAAVLLRHFRAHQWPVVHIQHLAVDEGATFFVPQTVGAEIHPLVAPMAGETVITKHFPNSFRETELRKSGIWIF